MIREVIAWILGSAGLFAFLQFLITRKDKKKDNSEEIIKKLDKLEKDSVRTQMLVLMADYPDDKQGVMKLAERYFAQLNGDWYMTGIFNRWLTENTLGKPEWFNPNN